MKNEQIIARGDVLRIVANTTHHRFNIGDLVTVTCSIAGVPRLVERCDGLESWIDVHDIELVEKK